MSLLEKEPKGLQQMRSLAPCSGFQSVPVPRKARRGSGSELDLSAGEESPDDLYACLSFDELRAVNIWFVFLVLFCVCFFYLDGGLQNYTDRFSCVCFGGVPKSGPHVLPN